MRELMRIVETANRIIMEETEAAGPGGEEKKSGIEADPLWIKINKWAKENDLDAMGNKEQQAALEKEFGGETPKLKNRSGEEVPFTGKILQKIWNKKMMTPAMQQSRTAAYEGGDFGNLDKATLQQFKKELNDAFNTSGKGKVAAIKSVLEDERFTSKDFKKALKSGLQDGDPEDDKVQIQSGQSVPNTKLRPTQGFIDFGKSVAYNCSNAAGFKDAVTSEIINGGGEIAVSPVGGEEYIILDGHHRWSGGACANPYGKKSALVYTFQTDNHKTTDAAAILGQMQVAIAGQTTPGQALPSAGGSAKQDIMNADSNRMYALFAENMGKTLDGQPPLMSDDWCKTLLNTPEIWSSKPIKAFMSKANITEVPQEVKPVGDSVSGNKIVCPFRDFMAKYVAYNWGVVLADNRTQIEGTPKSREDMPQLDNYLIDGGEGYDAIKKGLAQGKVQTGFDNIDDIVESKNNDDELLVERWNKLAGLL